MGFGDVLAGYGQAAFENHQNVLQMQYGMRRAAAEQLGKMADDERYDEASRQAFAQEGLNALTGDLTKPYKIPDFSKMQVQPPQAPAPPPLKGIGGAPGTPGTIQTPGIGGGPAESIPQYATAAINPRDIQLPQPAPPPTHPAMQQMNPTAIAQRQAPATIIGLQAKGAGEGAGDVQSMIARDRGLQMLYPDMDPEFRAFAATKMPMGAFLGTKSVPNVKGNSVNLSHDAFGQPIDSDGLYTVESNKMGQPIAAYPVNNPSVGGFHYVMDPQSGQWIEMWMDKTNKFHFARNMGVVPPAGVPRVNIHDQERPIQQANGDIDLVSLRGSTVSTKGFPGAPAASGQQQQTQPQPQGQAQPGAAAPTPPPVSGPLAGLMPGVAAPTAPPQAQTGPAPKAKVAGAAAGTANVPSGYLPSTAYAGAAPSGGPGRKVGGRPLPPQQEITDEQKVGGYGTALERASDVLNLWDDIAGKEKGGINGFIERLKMQTVTHPDGTASIVATNISNLSEKEKKFASAYSSLGEDITILRTIYGTPVSRGPESLKILLDQKGPLLGDPDVSKQILQNTVKSMLSSVTPLYRGLKKHGDTAPMPEGVRAAYLALNGDDPVKATAKMKQDGWF